MTSVSRPSLRGRRRLRAVVLSALLLAGGAASSRGQDRLCDLSKTPVFRVGDTVRVQETSSATSVVTAIEDGEIGNRKLEDTKTVSSRSVIYKVSRIDARGRPVELGVTVTSADEKTERTVPEASREKVSLKKVRFIARRTDGRFLCDPATITRGKGRPLTPGQKALLGKLRSVGFPAWPEDLAALLPGEPVRVGQAWRPDPASLQAWLLARPRIEGMDVRALSASFRVASVRGDVAEIQGDVSVRVTLEGRSFTAPLRLTGRIETTSGRWVGQEAAMTFALEMRDALAKTELTIRKTVTFRPVRRRAGNVVVRFRASEDGTLIHGASIYRVGRGEAATLRGLPAGEPLTLLFSPDGPLRAEQRVQATEELQIGDATVPRGSKGTVVAVVRGSATGRRTYRVRWDAIVTDQNQTVEKKRLQPDQRKMSTERITLDLSRPRRPEVSCFYYSRGAPGAVEGTGAASTDGALSAEQRRRRGILAAVLDAARKLVEPAGLRIQRPGGDEILATGRFDLCGLRLTIRTRTVNLLAEDDAVSVDLPPGPKGERTRLTVRDFVVTEPRKTADVDYAKIVLDFLRRNGLRVTKEQVGKDGVCLVGLEASGLVVYGEQ